MCHRTADSQLVGYLSSLCPLFIDECAGHICLYRIHRATIFDRSIRFGVETFLVSHATGQEDEDYTFGSVFEAFIVLLFRLYLTHAEEFGQSQTDSTSESNVHEVAT